MISAILVLFLNCGMRLSELAGINLTDIDDDLRSLRVIGKGSKERIIYLNEACRVAIVAYLPHRLKNCPESRRENALFLSRLGKRISVKTVQHLVKKHLYEAGLGNRNYSTHKLRHTAATLMYQTGNVDIRVLKDILGHEQLTTTQIYTHISSEGMERAMTQNPLSNVSPPESDELKSILSGDDEPDETRLSGVPESFRHAASLLTVFPVLFHKLIRVLCFVFTHSFYFSEKQTCKRLRIKRYQRIKVFTVARLSFCLSLSG